LKYQHAHNAAAAAVENTSAYVLSETKHDWCRGTQNAETHAL
jgi:hypothetical protein